MERDKVLNLLCKFSVHYPQARRTPTELDFLADEWLEDIGHFEEEVVDAAYRRYRRSRPYFPTVFEFLTICNGIVNARMEREKAMTERMLAEPIRTPEEQLAINRRGSAKMREVLGDFQEPWQ